MGHDTCYKLTCSFISCSYSLEPVGYSRYRKEISINKSSKTDMRKQARKPDTGNPPPGRRLPQSIPVVSCGVAPSQGHRRWFCILYRSSWSLGSPGVRQFLPSIPLDRCPPQLSHSPPFSSSASSPVGCCSGRIASVYECRIQSSNTKKPPRGLVV